MIDLNYPLLITAVVAQFILGAVWYSPLLFGKWWMQIMECTEMPPAELKKLQKEMAPFYGLQLLLTILTTLSLTTLMTLIPQFSPYYTAFFVWLGFIVPTQIAGVIWANTERKFWLKQMFVMVSYSIVGLMLAAWILSM